MTSDMGSLDSVPVPEREKADQLRWLARELAAQQDEVLTAVGRISACVRAGGYPDGDDLAQVSAWQEALAAAAVQAGHGDPAAFRLTDLEEAAALLDQLAAQRLDARLASMLAQIAGLADHAACAPVLRDVAARARALDPTGMPPPLKDAFRALHRLLMTPGLNSVDAADAELVRTEFTMPVMLASIGALRAPVPPASLTSTPWAPPAPERELLTPAPPAPSWRTRHPARPVRSSPAVRVTDQAKSRTRGS